MPPRRPRGGAAVSPIIVDDSEEEAECVPSPEHAPTTSAAATTSAAPAAACTQRQRPPKPARKRAAAKRRRSESDSTPPASQTKADPASRERKRRAVAAAADSGPPRATQGLGRFLTKQPSLSQLPALSQKLTQQQLTQSSEGDDPGTPAASQPVRVPDPAALLCKYTPTSEQGLVSSKIRNEEVLAWFQAHVQQHHSGRGPSPILLLCGPSGSGKGTLAAVAASKAGMECRAWEEDQGFGTSYSVGLAAQVRAEGQHDDERIGDTQLELFRRAITTGRSAGRRVTGTAGSAGAVVVLRGLPRCHTAEQRAARDDALATLARSAERRDGGCPVVLLLTTHDTHSTKFTLYRELPAAFINSPAVRMVELKGVSEAQLRKRLQHIAAREGMHGVSPQDIQAVAVASQGDLRQAVHQMCWRAIRPAPAPPRERPEFQLEALRGGCSLADGGEGEAPLSATRDESLEIGHGCARILSAKRGLDGKLTHSLDETLRLIGVPPGKIMDYVHSNLLRYCQVPSSLRLMAASATRLSEADCYLGALRGEGRNSDAGWAGRLALQWGVGHYQVANQQPSRPRGFEPSHPPPAWGPVADAPAALRLALSPAFPPDCAPHLSARTIGCDIAPALNCIVWRSRSAAAPASQRPVAGRVTAFVPRAPVGCRLTRAQLAAVRDASYYSVRQWVPGPSYPADGGEEGGAPLPPRCDLPGKWQPRPRPPLPYDLSMLLHDERTLVERPVHAPGAEPEMRPTEDPEDPIEDD
eukprot:TRINITY_DN15664_c0_g2_i1.p1 TRINITY_DN15664_c0_g2~~TRINITY_DN15664_c0_g2_i1.p1  ORF type:complete len:755 (+),score=119.21 TRINITY_DN15664_c0_g2_i1:102-2366(+)